MAAKSPENKQGCSNRSESSPAGSCDSGFCVWLWLLRGTFGQAGLGALLLWMALPRLNLWPLAFAAPIPWIMLIRRQKLPGRRPYLALWIVGFLFWFVQLHWLRMPHPATSLGWLVASAYMAFFLPLLVGLSRVAVHRLRVSVLLAAPCVWMGLELVRGHAFGGFTMASLGHAIYRWTAMIQTADIAGAYGVGALVMLLAACLGRMVPVDQDRRIPLWPAATAVAVLMLSLGYGYVRMNRPEPEQTVRVALIQGSELIRMDGDSKRSARMHKEHLELSRRIVTQHDDIDLIVWPETVFAGYLLTHDPNPPLPPDWEGNLAEFHVRMDLLAKESERAIAQLAAELETPVLVGVSRWHYGKSGEALYNSAACALESGEYLGHYDKIHLVMFGEYFPYADKLTWLYSFTPVNTLGLGLQAGDEPVAFEVRGLRFAPNICYETAMPHAIRRPVAELIAQGNEPDVLVNLTNDGWFQGSNELDLHMMCGIFRAVECRKPLLIAANTGLSAWIDGDGRVRELAPRMVPGTIVADVAKDGRGSLYLIGGDLPATLCLICCLMLAVVGWGDRRQKKKSKNTP